MFDMASTMENEQLFPGMMDLDALVDYVQVTMMNSLSRTFNQAFQPVPFQPEPLQPEPLPFFY